jgi:hypothetical protein
MRKHKHEFLINPLSANGQCHTIADAAIVFRNLIANIEYIRPMIKKKRATLHFDPCSNNLSLLKDEAFEATISQFRKIKVGDDDGADLTLLWYISIKNQPSVTTCDIATISITSTAPNATTIIEGTAIRETMRNDVNWLSFGGSAFNEAPLYQVNVEGTGPIEVKNAHNEISLQSLLPFFEHHTKHVEKPYFDTQRKENVAAMPIRNRKEAGNLLRIGIQHGNDIFSYHEASKKFFCFKLTGGNTYHGYEIEPTEILPALRAALKNEPI